MKRVHRMISPAIWLFYIAIVFEFLFMIAPFALYFYSAYRPALDLLAHSPWTAWLLGFFMPHFSKTTSPLLAGLGSAGWYLAYLGLCLFLVSAIQLYGAKLLRRTAVTGWLYRFVRHPQYLALAVLGLGTTLIWPRFLVLVTYVTMLSLYRTLARHEERDCLDKYGESYRGYQATTGMFLPRLRPGRDAARNDDGRSSGWLSLAVFAGSMGIALAAGLALREHTLASVSAIYLDDRVLVSPAPLSPTALSDAFDVAVTLPDARRLVEPATGRASVIVYVVPADWYLPDLPIDAPEYVRQRGGHGAPANFDRSHLRLLFAQARTFAHAPRGKDILRLAHGMDPLLIVDVNMTEKQPTGTALPPPEVVWGDIAAPLL